MRRTNKLYDIITAMNHVISVPLTCKLRTGIETNKNTAHNVMTMMRDNGVALATVGLIDILIGNYHAYCLLNLRRLFNCTARRQ